MRVAWPRPALDDIRKIGDWLMQQASGQTARRLQHAVRGRAIVLHDVSPGKDEVVAAIRRHHGRDDWQLDP